MPICQPCHNTTHDACDDTQHARDYRSCYCQHRIDRERTPERRDGGKRGRFPPETHVHTRDDDRVAPGLRTCDVPET